MTGRSDDPPPPPGGYPPPMFAPAAAPDELAPAAEPAPAPAEPAAEPAAAYPPPMFAPTAASDDPAPVAAIPEPAAPQVAYGAIASGVVTAPASGPVAAPTADDPSAPLLPATFHENNLRTAIGSPPMPEQISPRRSRDDEEDDDDGGGPRGRKAVLLLGGTLFVGVGIAALVIAGRFNADRYLVSCGAKEVTAERGRSFPPWGTSPLEGAEWAPIPIPPSFQCVGLETEDPAELGDAYRQMLVERAESLLTAKEVTEIDPAAKLLEQALLHARGGSEPHRAARQAIERMLGDVEYWRASAQLQKAVTDLDGAAKQFEAAAGQRPRYVSDANAWATHVRRLLDELRAGPAGAKALALPASPQPTGASASDRPAAPAGVALPVEPASGSAAGSAADPGAGSAPPAPDAGVPSGGVLL